MRAASASAIQSAAVEKCDLQSIESMCSYLAETVLEEELEEEHIAGDDDSVASCSDTEGSTAWLSKDLSMQSSDQEDTTVSDCTVEPPDYSKLDATIIVDSDISPPLKQSVGHRDDEARDLVVANLLQTLLNNKSGKGAKTKEQQERLDVLAMAMMSEEIRARRLQSAVTRVFGMSRAQQDRGLTLLGMQAKDPAKPILTMPKMGHSFGPKAKVDLDFVYDWLHNDCPLIEPDKSKEQSHLNKLIHCAGKDRRINCQRRILNATKKNAADVFLQSDVYHSWQRKMGRSLPLKTVESCFCFCIKDATTKECVCTVCTEFMVS